MKSDILIDLDLRRAGRRRRDGDGGGILSSPYRLLLCVCVCTRAFSTAHHFSLMSVIERGWLSDHTRRAACFHVKRYL